VSVSYSASTPGVSSGISGGWFEGVCEKVDLRYGRHQIILMQRSSCAMSDSDNSSVGIAIMGRSMLGCHCDWRIARTDHGIVPCRYTTIKSGRRRLLVPNSAFITREFMILDDAPESGSLSPRRGAETAPPQPQQRVAAYPGPPLQPQYQQTAPHDWVQRTLEAQPFHRDPSEPVQMPVGSHQQSSPADNNGGCAPASSKGLCHKACNLILVLNRGYLTPKNEC